MGLIPQSESTRSPLFRTLPRLSVPSPSGTSVACVAWEMPPLATLTLVPEGPRFGRFASAASRDVASIVVQPESAQSEGPEAAAGLVLSYIRVHVTMGWRNDTRPLMPALHCLIAVIGRCLGRTL